MKNILGAAFFLIFLVVAAVSPPVLAQADQEDAATTLPGGEAGGSEADFTGEGDFEDDFEDEFADEFADVPEAFDPLERFNRAMFWFNDKLYFYALKPAARVYRIIPEPVRVGVSNFFSNLQAPVSVVNALAQARINDGLHALSRFIINSTVGLAGFFDPAKHWAGLAVIDEDFGQTLGVYGMGQGPYLVIPFLGPTTLRDGFGRLVDWQVSLEPRLFEHTRPRVAAVAVDAVNTVSLDKDTYESIKEDALDPYLFIRDAYMQRRAGKVAR